MLFSDNIKYPNTLCGSASCTLGERTHFRPTWKTPNYAEQFNWTSEILTIESSNIFQFVFLKSSLENYSSRSDPAWLIRMITFLENDQNGSLFNSCTGHSQEIKHLKAFKRIIHFLYSHLNVKVIKIHILSVEW